jgi:transcriptional regulator with XRE-family HTH domain
MRSDVDDDSIGGRLRKLRRGRMTQEQLAARAGVSTVLISKLERGERSSARLPTLQKLATALDVPVSELIDRPSRLDGAEEGASVLALRDAILSPADVPGLGEGPGGEPAEPSILQRAVNECTRAYWAGDFAHLTAMLPRLIGSARAARQVPEWATGAAEILTRACDLAAALMVHLGKEDVAAVAAERALTAAEQAEDNLLVAAMQGTYAWVLLHQGRLDESERIAVAAADRVQPSFTDGDKDIAVWGNLLMTALAPAAAAGRDVDDYVRLASAGAERIGHRVRVWNTSFAGASVHMQAVHAYAVKREPAKALSASERLDVAELPGPISRGRHLLDVAQAQVDLRRDHDATVTLARARAVSPGWWGHQGVALVLVDELVGRQRRLPRALRELAEAAGRGGFAPYHRAAG